MGWRLMKAGARDWATNDKNDGGIRRPQCLPLFRIARAPIVMEAQVTYFYYKTLTLPHHI